MSHAPKMDTNTTDQSENPSGPARWLWRFVRRFLFARGYALIPVQEIEWLEASSLANHCAQKKHPQDSWDRGYFNGLADHASKTAYKLKQYYPPNTSLGLPVKDDKV